MPQNFPIQIHSSPQGGTLNFPLQISDYLVFKEFPQSLLKSQLKDIAKERKSVGLMALIQK